MSSSVEMEYQISHSRPKSFYKTFDRKEDLRHQTHYCPGCGHGIVHKMVARAIDELGIQDKTILVGPVGCSAFTYYYFDVGNVQSAHGRAPAVATAVKRSRPESIVIGYQGDGDLSAIGSAEILHAANRGENISIIFVNNAIYSMTGGQMAPTTLLGQKTMTTPEGRNALHDGHPLHVCELLATLGGPTYIERVGLGDNKQIAQANRAVKRAIENQVRGLGFSIVEVLSPCPTIWKMSPVEAQHWVSDAMEKTFPLGVFTDRTKVVEPRSKEGPRPSLEQVPHSLGVAYEDLPHDDLENCKVTDEIDLQIRVSGFGGQGVLLLGEVLAEAGLDSGLEVSWLPSYGPEMRSGTSNCHVRISERSIDSPLVAKPNFLLAMNEPSLHKFYSSVAPGGWVIYNGGALPEEYERKDIHVLAYDFTREADALGDPRAANMVVLGTLLEITRALQQESVDAALRHCVKNSKWVDLDERALQRGREIFRTTGKEVNCE